MYTQVLTSCCHPRCTCCSARARLGSGCTSVPGCCWTFVWLPEVSHWYIALVFGLVTRTGVLIGSQYSQPSNHLSSVSLDAHPFFCNYLPTPATPALQYALSTCTGRHPTLHAALPFMLNPTLHAKPYPSMLPCRSMKEIKEAKAKWAAEQQKKKSTTASVKDAVVSKVKQVKEAVVPSTKGSTKKA